MCFLALISTLWLNIRKNQRNDCALVTPHPFANTWIVRAISSLQVSNSGLESCEKFSHSFPGGAVWLLTILQMPQKFYSHKTYHVGRSIETSKLTQLLKPEMLLLGQCHCPGYCLLWDVWAFWLPQSSPSTSPLGSPWIQGPSLPGMTMPSLVSSSTGECTQYQVSGQSGSGTDGRSRIDQSMPSLWKTTTHPVSSMQILLRCSRPSFMTPTPGQTCWQSLVQGVYMSMCCTKSGNLLSRPH